MSKYNILRDDENQPEKPKPVKSEPDKVQPQEESSVPNEESLFDSSSTSPESEPKQTPGDDYFSDELFPVSPEQDKEKELEAQTEESAGSEIPVENEDQGFVSEPAPEEPGPMTYEETAESEYPIAKKEPERQALFDYEEDDKQEGLNYKPIFIGGGIVVTVVALFFIISNVFFADSEEEVPEQTVETAEQKLIREQNERKQKFLSDINRNTAQNLSSIYQLASLDQPKVKYSSVLLYGNTLNLEIFVPDREVMAKYNRKIKDDRNVEKYTIETVEQRRGSKGGFFALYGINLKKQAGTSMQAASNPVRVTPDTWSGTMVSKSGMTVNSKRSITSRQENLFRVSRVEYDLRGSIENSLSLINQLATTNVNVAIHKLTLLPTDQRNMSTSSYMLKLIVDFYL
jgi:hypothetical protein